MSNLDLLNAALSAVMEGQNFVSEKEFREKPIRDDGGTYQKIDMDSFHQSNLVGGILNTPIIFQRPSTSSQDEDFVIHVRSLTGKTITLNVGRNFAIDHVKQ